MNYVYYRLYKLGIKLGDHNPHEYAVFALGFTQMCFVWGLVQLSVIWGGIQPIYNLGYGILSAIFFIGFNYWNYSKHSFKEFDEKWKRESSQARIIKGLLVLIFIILSLYLFLGLSAHIYEMKNTEQ